MGMKEQAKAITDRMIARIEDALDSGEKLTWAKGCEHGLPMNFTSGKLYRGWNVFQCWMSGYERQLWAGLKQILKAGGRVRREEFGKPTWILLWTKRKCKAKPDAEPDARASFYWMSKALKVYNIDQCEGLPEDVVAEPQGADAVEDLDVFFAAYAAGDDLRMVHNADTPFPGYAPDMDTVLMPSRDRFHGTERFYSSLAHECGHATGHAKRLDREHAFADGRANYSKEELVAEFTAAILGATLGFDGAPEVENHAAYLRGWLKPLKDDPTFLGTAASAAQKAVDRIMVKAGVREPDLV